MEQRGVTGESLEYSQAVGAGGRFPLELLAPELEQRATTDTDSAAQQQTWLDRLFAGTEAAHLGISMRSVSPGVASLPIATAGASAAQHGRQEAAVDAAWTVSVTEIKPSRNAVRAVFPLPSVWTSDRCSRATSWAGRGRSSRLWAAGWTW